MRMGLLLIPKREYITLCAEVEQIEARLNILNPDNNIEREEISRHMLRLEQIRFMLTIVNNKSKLSLIENES